VRCNLSARVNACGFGACRIVVRVTNVIPYSTNGACTLPQRRMIIHVTGPFPERSHWCRRGRKLESHRDERVPLSPRTAHRQTCAGLYRPGAANGESFGKIAEKRSSGHAVCAAQSLPVRMRAYSRAIGEAPMRGAGGADKHFDWLRCEAPNRDIAALEVKL